MAFNFSSWTAGCYGCWSTFPETQKNQICLYGKHDDSSHLLPPTCLRRQWQNDWKPAWEGIRGVIGSGLPGILCPGGMCSITPCAFLTRYLPALLPVWHEQWGQANTRLTVRHWWTQAAKIAAARNGWWEIYLPLNFSSVETSSGRMRFRKLLGNISN